LNNKILRGLKISKYSQKNLSFENKIALKRFSHHFLIKERRKWLRLELKREEEQRKEKCEK
jgi:hypothetical protein